jgi:hypothetical protein
MNFKNQSNKKIFQCEICGLKYPNKKLAKKCEAWCRNYNSCNLEIIKYSIQNNAGKK